MTRSSHLTCTASVHNETKKDFIRINFNTYIYVLYGDILMLICTILYVLENIKYKKE